MKHGKTLAELRDEILRQNDEKRDFLMPAHMMEMGLETEAVNDGTAEEPKPRLVSHPTISFADPSGKGKKSSLTMRLNDTAHSDMAEFVGIPLQYYRRMATEAPGLLRDNVNEWLARKSDKRMVRTLDNKVRAVLSDRYRQLDNFDLAAAVLPEIMKPGFKVESCELTEKRLYLKVVSERSTMEVKKGDPVQSGLSISNSEIGSGRLEVSPLLYRLVCSNGLIMPDSRLRQSHVGRGVGDLEGAVEFYRDATRQADDKAFWMKVTDTVRAAFEQLDFAQMAQRFYDSQEDKITAEPEGVVDLTAKKFSLNESEKKNVLRHLLISDDMSRFGLVNAVTRAAQDVESYDRSTELEKLGGQILEMPHTDWNRLAAA